MGISAQKNRHIFTQSRVRSAQKVRNPKLTTVVKKLPFLAPSQEIRPKGRNLANGQLFVSFRRSRYIISYHILSHPEVLNQSRSAEISAKHLLHSREESTSSLSNDVHHLGARAMRAAFPGDPTVASPWHRADGWCPCGEGRSSGGITQLHHGSILHGVQTCDWKTPRSKGVQMVMMLITISGDKLWMKRELCIIECNWPLFWSLY